MRRVGPLLSAVGALIAAVPVGAVKPPLDHIYGPPPAWSDYRRIAEADIARRLIDPESARITWLGGYRKDEFKPFLEPRVAGYVACGTVNARNRMGGYTGATTFVTVIDYDRVLYAEIDNRAGGMIDENCAAALKAGLFPPLPAGEAAGATASSAASVGGTTSNAATGLTLRAMPDGAYVSEVTAGSPAAAAGLKPGMVIASVNAIPLAGMNDAMLKVVDAAGPAATFAIVGGGTVKLGGKP